MSACTLIQVSCRRSRSTDLEASLGEPGTLPAVWIKDKLESVSAPGVAGAILTKAAFRSRRETYASAPHMVVISEGSVLKKERSALRHVCVVHLHSYLRMRIYH